MDVDWATESPESVLRFASNLLDENPHLKSQKLNLAIKRSLVFVLENPGFYPYAEKFVHIHWGYGLIGLSFAFDGSVLMIAHRD